MVVDDDVDIRLLVGRWLEDAGYEVVACETGAEALAKASDTTAVACVDLGLGDMTGLDVLRLPVRGKLAA